MMILAQGDARDSVARRFIIPPRRRRVRVYMYRMERVMYMIKCAVRVRVILDTWELNSVVSRGDVLENL